MTTSLAIVHANIYSSVNISSYFINRDELNEKQSNVFAELQNTLNTSKLSFKEIDCSIIQKECQNVHLKGASSYRLYSGDKLVDIYYGSQTIEHLRKYCMAKLGFRMPRSLPIPASGRVANSNNQFTARLLTNRNFDKNVKNGLTFIM